MTKRVLVLFVSAVALAGCRAPNPERQLREAFVQQIASTAIVRDLQTNGDEVTFSARYGDELDAKWRVHIDSATVEHEGDGTTPDKGTVKSSWYVNGEQIRPRGDQSDLPLAFLDAGVAQECWAFWDKGTGRWSWK